jgi:outer membrane protein OmpU
MNKITKLGVSALCGSLAAVSSANAGDLAVSGGIDMSWISKDDAQTGNNLGIGSNYSLTGSGELDNGWGVALAIAMTNKNTYSSTNVTVTVPAAGSFRISSGVSGSGIDRIDDATPNVWEEAYATGLSTGINTVGGASGGSNIEWTPNMLPEGITGRVSYSPDVTGSGTNDKGSSGASTTSGAGYDVTVELSDAVTGMSGLTIYGGISDVKNSSATDDREEETIGVKYAMGGLTVGYQWSEEDLGTSTNEQQYENDGYGITFAINDDLSVGYNHYESQQTSTTNVTAEASSLQVAYSMGGASLRIAQAESDNEDYNTGAEYDKDATTISVSLAF